MSTETVPLYETLTSTDWIHQSKDNADGLIQYDEPPSYETFIRECFIPNRPALFTAKCGLMKQWSCLTDWLTEDGTKPDFDRLISHFGHLNVPVTKCSLTGNNEYASDENKLTMRFDEFVNLWRQEETTSNYYCKDWHLQKYSDQEKKDPFYSIPIYFRSDWLNEKCLADQQDDFRFVYMGGNHTHTPIHMDVLGTYSWSANICGRKKWHFSKPYTLDFIQEAGEIVFVPSEWYHHVTNIGDTISINHNWFNAFNIHRIWKHLCLTLEDIEQRIDDCRSSMRDTWHEHCQLILQANEGMNFASLYKLLHTIAQHRINEIITTDLLARFDLWMIEKLIRQMLQSSAFLRSFDFDTFPQRPKTLLNQIHTCIDQQKQKEMDG